MAGQPPSASASKGPALIPLGHHTGKPPIPLHRPVTVIGSRSNARIHLTSSTVSKAHALVVKDGPNVYIRDLASRTHVYVNGDKIRDQFLEDGDLIKIGSFTFKFRAGQALNDPSDHATSAAPAKLEVTGADYPVPIDERVLLIGRRQSCDVHLLEESCSTAHAVIFEMNGHRHVRDLGSRTGTYVNGVAVHQHQLNPGDDIRIGETTLTYTPSAELATAEVEAPAGSVLDLEVVDDTARHGANADELDVASIEPASTEKPLPRGPLSEADENLSPVEEPAETASTDVQPEAVAEEEDLSPRRGWRPAAGVPVEEVADEALTSSAPAAEQQDAAPQKPAHDAQPQQDDDLLRFAPTTSATDEAEEFTGDTTGADQGAGAAVLDIDEPQITAGQFTESDTTTRSDDERAVDDLLELASEEIEEQRDERKPLQIDLSDSATARAERARPPEPSPEAAPGAAPGAAPERSPALSMDALDFSTLPGDGASADVAEPLDTTDEIPLVEPIAPASQASAGMRFDREEPIAPAPSIADETPAPPVEEEKPKRGRRGKKSKDAPVEKVAASRTRRKPKDEVAEQPPAEQVIEPVEELPALDAPKEFEPKELEPIEPAAAQSPDEIISPTEPTPESALDLDRATTSATSETSETSETSATFDEAAIEQTLGDQTVSDPLTDTGLSRAVHDLTGDVGEIVEEPTGAAPPAPAPAPFTPRDPVSEAPAPAPAPEQPANATHPSYKWGANQDNFLGGVPVTLPPVNPNSRRPATPIAQKPAAPVDEPVEVIAEPTIELNSDDSHDQTGQQTGQQIDEVNALIDEILAPTVADDGEIVATKDDLLAQPPANDAPASLETESPAEEDDATPDLLNDATPPPLRLPMPEEPSVAARLVDPHGPSQSRPVIPIPPPPLRGRRPARRERGERGERGGRGESGERGERAGQVVAPGLREDERIPPYAGAASATVGRVTVGFDGLAMPPVREADVFSQMSPPATTTGEDPFGAATGAASASALTPMDMVQAEEPPAARTRRPVPMTGRAPVPRDLIFGNPPGAATSVPPPAAAPAPSAPLGPIEEQLSGGHRRRPPVRPAIPGTTDRTSAIDKALLDDASAETAVGIPSPVVAPKPRRGAPVVMGEEDFEAAHAQRRRRTRWITTLLIVGFLVWAGAMGAIFALFRPASLTQVKVKFRNYEFLSTNEARQFQEEQQKFLNLEQTRITARRMLHQSDPEIPNGFLDDVEKYLATASLTAWPENQKGLMQISHRGTADPGNKARVAAMAQALYSQNQKRIDDAKNAETQLRNLRDAIARDEQERKRLVQDIEQLRIQGDSAPDAKTIKQINDEVQQLERAWGDALAAVKSAEAELKRLKQEAAPVDAPPNNSTASAAPAADETLTAMETQLAELTTKLTAAQNVKKQQADAARKALDQTLKGFEQQLGTAKQLMKDSPELSAYVTAAQRLQETTRVVIDDIIRRQEQQYGRLIELKQTLTEKLEQRRNEQLSGNPELKELNERLATATRQLNAAKNSGMQKEADEKQEQVKLLTNMIKAKQDLLPPDPAMKDFADTIAQIQQIIDTVQTNVEGDRKRADQLLADAQQNFASNAAVEKLPEAQKSVATELEQRMAAINAAREQYNQAISATAVDDDDATKQLRQQAAAIQTAMDARKKELADAAAVRSMSPEQQKARQDAIPLKEKELTELQKAEANARLAYTNREKDYRDAQAASKLARDSLDQLTELQKKQDILEKKIAQARAQEPLKKDQAERAVMPEPVSEADVTEIEDKDKRPILWLSSSAVVFVLFAGLMLFALHSTSGGMPAIPSPAPSLAPSPSIDEIGDAHSNPQSVKSRNGNLARTSSNGDGNGQHDAEDDSEPQPI